MLTDELIKAAFETELKEIGDLIENDGEFLGPYDGLEERRSQLIEIRDRLVNMLNGQCACPKDGMFGSCPIHADEIKRIAEYLVEKQVEN